MRSSLRPETCGESRLGRWAAPWAPGPRLSASARRWEVSGNGKGRRRTVGPGRTVVTARAKATSARQPQRAAPRRCRPGSLGEPGASCTPLPQAAGESRPGSPPSCSFPEGGRWLCRKRGGRGGRRAGWRPGLGVVTGPRREWEAGGPCSGTVRSPAGVSALCLAAPQPRW